jgi:hypothetical protein
VTTENPSPKERIYDEQISPLMMQIIALCKEHKINAFADFSLGLEADEDAERFDEPLFCTTALPVDEADEVGCARVNRLRKEATRRSDFAAFTITTGPGPTK